MIETPFCYGSLPSGTFVEVLLEKTGYENGTVSGFIHSEDAHWTVAMNPIVITKIIYSESSWVHYQRDQKLTIYLEIHADWEL